MTASVELLSWLVYPALFITMVSPVLLILFLIRDWKGRTLW